MSLFSVFVCCFVASGVDKSPSDSKKSRPKSRMRFWSLLEALREQCSRGAAPSGTASEAGLQTRSEKPASRQCPLGHSCGCAPKNEQVIKMQGWNLCTAGSGDLINNRLLHNEELSDLGGSQDFCTIDLSSRPSLSDEVCICLGCAGRCTHARELIRASVLWRAAQLEDRYGGALLGR